MQVEAEAGKAAAGLGAQYWSHAPNIGDKRRAELFAWLGMQTALDHDLPSPLLAQAFGDDPKVGIYRAARCRIRNDPYRPVRIVLRTARQLH